MKLTSRVLLGTLAMAAAVTGSAASAHADTAAGGSADDSSSATNALLCPFVTSGPLNTVLNDLNPQSVPGACGSPNTNLATGNQAAANQAAANQAAAHK